MTDTMRYSIPPGTYVRDEPDGIYIMTRGQSKEKISDPGERDLWHRSLSEGVNPDNAAVIRWKKKDFIVKGDAGCPEPAPGSREIAPRTGLPIYMTLGITSECDCRCRHCGNDSGPLCTDALSDEEITELIGQMSAFPLLKLNFTGGEPTLHPKLADYISQAKKGIPRITMTSNGRNITSEMAYELANAGLDMVKLSIDGMEGFHDGLRGIAGTWRKAIDAIGFLAEAGVEVRVQSTLMDGNQDDLIILMGVMSSLGVTHHAIVPVCPIGRASGNDIMLSPEGYRDFLGRMARRISGLRTRGSKTNYQAHPLFGGQEMFEELTAGFETLSSKYTCEALLNTMEVRPDGSVVGCSFLDMPIGDIRESPLSDIWDSAEAARVFNMIQTTCDSGACATCSKAGDSCSGGCLANRLSSGRDVDPYCFACDEKEGE